MEHVKPRRRYDSSGRQAQARRNRQAILDAAWRQFLQGGYAATTIAAIAAEAGVSVETVSKAFGGKAGLVRAIYQRQQPRPRPARQAPHRFLLQRGYLREDVTVAQATDILWTCNSAELYDLLVLQRRSTGHRWPVLRMLLSRARPRPARGGPSLPAGRFPSRS